MADGMTERESYDSLLVGLAGCSKIRGARAVLFPAPSSAPSGIQARRPPLSLATQQPSARSESQPKDGGHVAEIHKRYRSVLHRPPAYT